MTRHSKLAIKPQALLQALSFVAVVEILLISIGLFIIYPDTPRSPATALILPIVVTIMIFLLIVKMLPKLKDRAPQLYRIELILTAPALLMSLATIDWTLSRLNPENFHQLVTKGDALYFAVTTMATVGYGDIYPKSQPARLWVTAQIIIGVVFVIFILQKEFAAARSNDK